MMSSLAVSGRDTGPDCLLDGNRRPLASGLARREAAKCAAGGAFFGVRPEAEPRRRGGTPGYCLPGMAADSAMIQPKLLAILPNYDRGGAKGGSIDFSTPACCCC